MVAYLEHANITVPDIDAAIAFLKVVEPNFVVRHDATPEGSYRWCHIGTDQTYIGCDRAIPKILSDGIALVDGSERERMGLPARGAFGEMVDMFTTAMFTLRKPLHDPSYANQDPVDNDL